MVERLETLSSLWANSHVINVIGISTVDLSIVSWDRYHTINYFNVLDPAWFSDHCPVTFSIKSDQFLFEEKIDRSEFKELGTDHYFSRGGGEFSRKLE